MPSNYLLLIVLEYMALGLLAVLYLYGFRDAANKILFPALMFLVGVNLGVWVG